MTLSVTSTSSPTTSPSTMKPSSTTNSPINQQEVDNLFSVSHNQSCDLNEIDSSWSCSNASNNHSLCIKKCHNGISEHKKCICKRTNCSWAFKNKDCLLTGYEPTTDVSGNQDQFSSEILRSLIQYLKLVNKGQINVNFRLR